MIKRSGKEEEVRESQRRVKVKNLSRKGMSLRKRTSKFRWKKESKDEDKITDRRLMDRSGKEG